MNDIILKPIQEADLEVIRNWRNSPDVSQYMYSDKEISREDQQKWYDRIKNDSTCSYWIINYNDKPLGVANITGVTQLLESCYWAFYLGDTSVRGGGIGAKVEYNVLKHVFEDLKLNKLRCEVFAFNDKVIKMHEKFGFRREAYYREHCKKEGVYKDVVGLALLKSEWNVLKDELQKKIYGK